MTSLYSPKAYISICTRRMGIISSLKVCSLDYRCFMWLGTSFLLSKPTSVLSNLGITRLQCSHSGEGTTIAQVLFEGSVSGTCSTGVDTGTL